MKYYPKKPVVHIISIVCCAVLCVALAACGAGGTYAAPENVAVQSGTGTNESTPEAPTPEPTAEAENIDAAESSPEDDRLPVNAAPPLSFEEDIGITIDGEWFPIWQDAAGLLKALGNDYELYAAPSCVFDEGDDKEFAYDGCYVYTNPNGSRDIWYSIFLENDTYSTARGISVGSALDDVIKAYGENYYWEGDTVLTYSVSGIEGDISSPCIQFTLAEEVVTAIEIYYPTNTT